MKRSISVLGLGLLLGAWIAAPAGATSLFLADWGVSYGAWAPNDCAPGDCYSVVEDWTGGGNGWLDPGFGGDLYDAEAAYLSWDADYLYLGVITGFPITGRWHHGEHLAAGDIALDVTGDGVYDYAVDISEGGALRSGNLDWRNPCIDGVLSPWGGVADPLLATSWDRTDPIAGFRYGTFSGRYAIEAKIDRGMLGATGDYKLHWTMGCGNDALDLYGRPPVEPVPEPASLLLFGAGLAAAGAIQRFRRKT